MAAGFDPIWFGVLIVVMNGIAQITPPIGMNVFAMSSIAEDVPIYEIFKNIIPFWIAYIIFLIILVLFPTISLLLPNIIM
jgi:TRAP-type C4-dicarboxylate transport system permease large subunit